MNSIKEIDIKNRTYYFFDDVINKKSLDPKKIKIAQKTCKNILICHFGYVIALKTYLRKN